MDNNPHIFLTRANQQIKETNRNFCGNLDSDGPMVFAKNQEKMNPKQVVSNIQVRFNSEYDQRG